jgi:probable phosphoglycerate mutase
LLETRILLLRHAETSAPDRLHGAESDVGLGERGVRQAEAVASWLANERPDLLVSSAMRRALDTCLPIAKACGLPIEVEPALHERKLGPISGVLREEALPSLRETTRRWMNGECDYAPSGCESYSAMRGRVLPAFLRVVERSQERTAVVVAHGMVIRVLLTSILDDLGVADLDRIKIDNVAVNDLRWDGDRWRAVELNMRIGESLDRFSW